MVLDSVSCAICLLVNQDLGHVFFGMGQFRVRLCWVQVIPID